MTKYKWKIADITADSVFDPSVITGSVVAGWATLDSDTVSLFATMMDLYLNNRASVLGLHLTGVFDEEYTGTSAQIALIRNALWYPAINKYFPYLKVLDGEFIAIKADYETTRSHTSSARSMGGGEENPVSDLPISPVAETEDWLLDNPSNKYGSKTEATGGETEHRLDPALEKRLLDFSIGSLNLTKVCELICNKLIDEYNSIL